MTQERERPPTEKTTLGDGGQDGNIFERQHRYLLEFVLQVRQLYPDIQSYNPYKDSFQLPEYMHHAACEALLEQVVHCITILNQLYRVRNGNHLLESSREDMLAGMSLMQDLLNPALQMSMASLEAYRLLSVEKGEKGLFTRKELQELTGYSKTHCNRLLHELQEVKLILLLGGYKNRGYVYQVEKLVRLSIPERSLCKRSKIESLEKYSWLV